MTLVHEIIKDAFREANLVPINQSPTLDEQTEGLRLLNRYVRSVFGNEAGDKLTSCSLGGDTSSTEDSCNFSGSNYVPPNTRLIVNLSSATTINLHPCPQDGSRVAVVDNSGNLDIFNLTINGNGRKIDAAATAILDTASLKKEWLYRDDISSWTTITDISLNDVFPFPVEFDDLFIIGLAMRINPRNGVSVDDQSSLTYRRIRNQFRARYLQIAEQCSEDGLLRLTGTKKNNR